MRRFPLVLCLVLATGTARADVPNAVSDHILPGLERLAQATADLAKTTDNTCDADAIKPGFQAASDAWMAVQHLRFGPMETEGRGLAIYYWPDPKGLGAKAQAVLLAGDPAMLTAATLAGQSVAARGLPALERLLYPTEALPADPCLLIRATSADLAQVAGLVLSDWQGGFGKAVATAGEAGNTLFPTGPEARQVMFAQLVNGLETLKDQRLGRPLGDFATPHPERAEGRASGRSQRNVVLSLQAMRAMVESLTPDAPLTIEAFDHAIQLAETLDDPDFSGIGMPGKRLKVEILQQAVGRALELVLSELGPEMDVGIGFNAGDGD